MTSVFTSFFHRFWDPKMAPKSFKNRSGRGSGIYPFFGNAESVKIDDSFEEMKVFPLSNRPEKRSKIDEKSIEIAT